MTPNLPHAQLLSGALTHRSPLVTAERPHRNIRTKHEVTNSHLNAKRGANAMEHDIVMCGSLRRWRHWRVLCSTALIAAACAADIRLAAGSERAPVRYNLAACIETALAVHPDVWEAAWDIEIARMRLEEAKRGGYPDAQYTQLFGIVNRARGNVLSSPDEDTDFLEGLGPFTRLNLEIRLPIYTFGKLSAGKEAARRGVETEEAKRVGRENQVIFDVKEMYFGFLLSRQISDVLSEISTNLENAIETATERLETGDESIAQRDVLKLRVAYSRLAQEARKVVTGQQLARAGLMRAMGLDPEAPFETADRRLVPADVNLKPLHAYVDELFRNNPQWRRLRAGIEARRARVVMARSEYFPVLFVAGGVEYARAPNRRDQKNPFVKDDFNFLSPGGALGMRWSLNFGTTRLNVETAEAELAKLRVQERAARSGLPLEVRKAYAAVEEARDKMTIAREGRKAGRGLLVTAMSSFTLGVGDAEDLFTGLGLYAESAAGYYESIHDHNMALAELSRSVGVEVTHLSYKRP
jgi:outer membrane protein TolC